MKIAKIKDGLIWHCYENEDEMFLVFKGTLIMEFKDETIEIKEGEILIPKNHRIF